MQIEHAMNVLSIQSEVVYGHVGNSAARFVLQRLGHEVWAIPTVLFSNHPGHRGMRGDTTPAATMRGLINGLDERGWLKHCDAVLSGYLGVPDHAEIVANAVKRVKTQNPGALYYCDPVFGDNNGAYAKPGVAEAMARHLIPIADAIFPNRFELQGLTARRVNGHLLAAAAARALGRPLVIATSIIESSAAGQISTLAVTANEMWVVSNPLAENAPHGTGDVFAAAFLSHRLNGVSIPDALQRASSAVDHLVRASVAAGTSEMPLIAEQSVFDQPLKPPS
jgi:pyridoxine kinase